MISTAASIPGHHPPRTDRPHAYLTTTSGGAQAMADAGISASRPTIRAWATGRQRPRPENLEAIDTAYWNLRATNVLANPGALKQHLNRGGQGTRMEIHPINQDVVDEPRRRDNLRVAGSRSATSGTPQSTPSPPATSTNSKQIWDDVIAELDSDWGAYTYVAYIGLGA